MNINETQMYYWSPSVKWEQKPEGIKIEMFVYKDFVPGLFPTFYFLSQNGISFNDVYNNYADIPRPNLRMFLIDLVKKRILVNNILTPHELYFSQNKLHYHGYSESIKYDETDLKKFKEKQLSRQYFKDNSQVISLLKENNIPDIIKYRRTYRRFIENKKISFRCFSNFLAVLQQYSSNGEVRYYYGSAGGLYPIDVYLHVKAERIEEVKEGIYYYNPIQNQVIYINDGSSISDDCHYYTNQAIYNSSAFTLYFVYNCNVSMPKYEGMGYYYAAIDTGIIVSTLTNMAELNSLGVCSIGDMVFEKIKGKFHLAEHQVYLHSLEVGLKN